MWRKININKNNIVATTNKAVLIKMPNNSSYKGYCFWHPAKLIKNEGGNGYFYSFSYNEDFEFKLEKKGKNFKLIAQDVIDYETMEAEFDIVSKHNTEDITIKIVKPKKIKEFEVVIDDDLKL